MDTIDKQIIELLHKNARMKASDISRQVHLAVSTVIERIHRLEDEGVIERYVCITTASKLGYKTTAMIEVSLEHARYNEVFAKEIAGRKQIIACYYMTGDYDYLLKVCCESEQKLEGIHAWVKSRKGVRATRTNLVLSNIKNEYSILP